MYLFEIKSIAFKIWGYSISFVELFGTFFGLVSVLLASRAKILTWGTGIVNEFFFFILFFQLQLYADMFLQIYFFIVSLYGWYSWKSKRAFTKVSETNFQTKIFIVASIIIGTFISGFLLSKIHLYLPEYFKIKAAYPFVDSFVMVSSIVATLMLAKKKIENWYLWILIDLVCVFLYFEKGVYILSIEYFIFLLLAAYGLYNWKKQLNND
jgi:nicotinamide mononucleotide transporter